MTTPVRLSRFCYNNAHVAKRKKVVHVILKGDCGKGGFLLEHATDDNAVYTVRCCLRDGEKGGVWGVLNGMPDVVVHDVRLLE